MQQQLNGAYQDHDACHQQSRYGDSVQRRQTTTGPTPKQLYDVNFPTIDKSNKQLLESAAAKKAMHRCPSKKIKLRWRSMSEERKEEKPIQIHSDTGLAKKTMHGLYYGLTSKRRMNY